MARDENLKLRYIRYCIVKAGPLEDCFLLQGNPLLKKYHTLTHIQGEAVR